MKGVVPILALTMAAGPGFATAAHQAGGGTIGGGTAAPRTSTSVQPLPLRSGKPTAAISGVVRDAATRQPIAGAVVYLGLQEQGAVGRTSQQVTDARGRFVFTELWPADLYFLNVSRFGYLDGAFGMTRGVTVGSRIALGDGEWFSGADVELSKLGAIGGVVTDEFGEAIVGAFVRAIAKIRVNGQPQMAAGALVKTDDRGEYRIPGLTAGSYLVELPSVQSTVPAATPSAEIEGLNPEMWARAEAQAARLGTSAARLGTVDHGAATLVVGGFLAPPPPAGGHDRAYPITFFPGVSSIGSATTIDLGAGENKSNVNVSLQPVASVTIAGHVEGLGAGAGRHTMRLIAAGLEGLGTGSEAATTIVEPNGSFTFLNVPAGTYAIDARQSVFEFMYRPVAMLTTSSLPMPPGRALLGAQHMGQVVTAPFGTSYSSIVPPVGVTYYGRTMVTAGSSDVTNVIVTLQPAVAIRGKYAYEDMPNGVTRTPPTYAEPTNGNWSLGLLASAEHDEAVEPGGFAIRGLLPGQYVLRPTVPPMAAVKAITIDGQDYLKKPIDVSAGRDVTDVVITLTGKTTELAGAVRDAQGQPAVNGYVVAFTTDRTLWTAAGLGSAWIKVTPASTAGAFSFSSLRAGDYYVIAVDAARVSGWTDSAFLSRAAAMSAKVTLEWGATTRADLVLTAIK